MYWSKKWECKKYDIYRGGSSAGGLRGRRPQCRCRTVHRAAWPLYPPGTQPSSHHTAQTIKTLYRRTYPCYKTVLIPLPKPSPSAVAISCTSLRKHAPTQIHIVYHISIWHEYVKHKPVSELYVKHFALHFKGFLSNIINCKQSHIPS